MKEQSADIENALALAGVKPRKIDLVTRGPGRNCYLISVGAKEALPAWRALTDIAAETGFCPIFPDKGFIERLGLKIVEKFPEPSPISSTGGPVFQIVDNALSKTMKGYPFHDWVSSIAAAENMDIQKWIKNQQDADIEVGDYSKRPYSVKKLPVYNSMIVIPVKRPWHIPAFLGFGGWNACPPAEIHVALLKSWYERYGAEPVILGKDSLFLSVQKPIQTKDEALKVAREHFAYCPDNIVQGGGDNTLSGCANDILKAKIWHFWWD